MGAVACVGRRPAGNGRVTVIHQASRAPWRGVEPGGKDYAMSDAASEFQPLSIAILTVSDSRTPETDKSGRLLGQRVEESGHRVHARRIVVDDRYEIRAAVSAWIADPDIQVVLTTGGTGVTGRDVTPESVRVLFDREIEGFGELFRQLSYEEIGPSTLQSRAVAGVANATLLFVLPGSSGACRTAWDEIIAGQLDIRTRPCNFVTLLPRMRER